MCGKTVFKTAQRRATLIARTETLRAHNEGRKVFYRQVEITKVRWLIAHDERRCWICWLMQAENGVRNLGDCSISVTRSKNSAPCRWSGCR